MDLSVRARDNPFRTERTDNLRYRAPGFDWGDLMARLEVRGGRGALRGAQGTGKTTLLRELGVRLAGLGLEVRSLRPSLDDRRLATSQVRELPRGAGSGTALLLDGADRVGLFEWWRLVRSAQPAGILVVTTHREGRLPTLHRCETSAALLSELATELTAATELSSVSLVDLFSREQGNVRTALRSLYDRFAEI